MIDVEQNNWILPISPEDKPPTYAKAVGMEAYIAMQPPRTFNFLDALFWRHHFNAKPYKELLDAAEALGVRPKQVGRPNKATLVNVLTRYFRELSRPSR